MLLRTALKTLICMGMLLLLLQPAAAAPFLGVDETRQAIEGPVVMTTSTGIEASKTIESQSHNRNRPKKTRAPEPSTMALFLSGIMTAVLGFVRRVYFIIKRVMDVLLSIAAIVLLSPLFLITALLIKGTSKGPVFYTQWRVGKDGKLFKIIKFRTMRVDAEKETGAVWAKENDPRLIPVGWFLRKTRIDEIPQFFNVIKGEMSVIGPRPERPEFVEKLKREIKDYDKRLAVKPGITGLAQVRHSYDTTIKDVRRKIKYDLLYIRKLCLWTDLFIFLRTFRVVLTGQGAR